MSTNRRQIECCYNCSYMRQVEYNEPVYSWVEYFCCKDKNNEEETFPDNVCDDYEE